MKIAVFAQRGQPSSHYRAFEPLLELARRGHPVWLNDTGTELPPDPRTFDVALISRYQGPPVERLMRQLRGAGVAVVWDHDDAMHHSPLYKSGGLRTQQVARQIRTILGLCDVVTTTNAVLAEQYAQMGAATVRVIENYLGESYAGLGRAPHDGIVVGWAAFWDHRADWSALGLHNVFLRLLEAHPDVRVESVGAVDLGLPPERYVRGEPVPFDRLAQQLTRFDIGIAPIADHPFNASRSNIKVKEYAAAGIPWLASPIGPYAGLGEQQGGRLVPDDGWEQALDELIRKDRLRRKLAKRGRKWAASQLLARHVGHWERTFAEAIERGGYS
jgi:glycosyltransferase involved in cell wall biosynthesis